MSSFIPVSEKPRLYKHKGLWACSLLTPRRLWKIQEIRTGYGATPVDAYNNAKSL